MDNPKVLHLLRTWLHPMETFIEEQIAYAMRYDPVVLCHRRLEHRSSINDRVHSIEEVMGPVSRSIDRMAYESTRFLPAMTVRAAQEFIRKVEPRIIHAHYLVDVAFYSPLLRDINVPVLVSGYGYDVSRFPGQAFGLGKLYLSRGFDPPNLFLAMSEHMKQDFIALGVAEEDIRVHYHGIDTSKFSCPEREYGSECEGESESEIRILSCGRLVPKKGHEVLLKAIKVLMDRNGLSRRLSVWIVGDGPLRGSLERLSAALDLQSTVIFKGHVPYQSAGYAAQYRQADIFVLPCHTVDGTKEGVPGTLIEAMASGLPVISTVHAGIPEIVRNSVDGLLVGEDSVDELADALGALIAHADLRRALGRAAAQRAVEFDIRNQTIELERIYSSLTGEEEKPKRKGGAKTPD